MKALLIVAGVLVLAAGLLHIMEAAHTPYGYIISATKAGRLLLVYSVPAMLLIGYGIAKKRD